LVTRATVGDSCGGARPSGQCQPDVLIHVRAFVHMCADTCEHACTRIVQVTYGRICGSVTAYAGWLPTHFGSTVVIVWKERETEGADTRRWEA
jgi:hypothetical protein